MFDEVRQRRALRLLERSPNFLRTSEGLAFIAQLRSAVAPGVLSTARRAGLSASWLDVNDVVHTALVELTRDRGRAARYAAASVGEPWAYVSRCLTGWMRDQWGTRAEPLQEETLIALRDERTHHAACDGGLDCGACVPPPMEAVIERMFLALAPALPTELRPPLKSLLRWCALNPPQRRSYEHADRAAAVTAFPMLPSQLVVLITQLSRGTRPRNAETSLMGAFLSDPTFRVSDSPLHTQSVLRWTAQVRGLCHASERLPAAATAHLRC